MENYLDFEEDLLSKEIYAWEHSGGEKGQIYTKPEIVELMLKVIGLWDIDVQGEFRVLEPSCGEGEFVCALIERMLLPCDSRPPVEGILSKILAIDLVESSLNVAKEKANAILCKFGYSDEERVILTNSWFRKADFLLEQIDGGFTHVIGNPPYVRVESIPKRLLDEYRRRFEVMTDRADLYIPFFEKSLKLLSNGGALSFVCTDRWTKNIYGKKLRQLVSDSYNLEVYIDLYGVDVFESEVLAYPAITQIRREKNLDSIVVHGKDLDKYGVDELLSCIGGGGSTFAKRRGIVNGEAPWLLGSPDQINLIRRIEAQFPMMEDCGCKVYIGTATGANKVFIVEKNSVDIEDSRLIPVITASEIKDGIIKWSGKYIIYTHDDSGVIDLEGFPKLKRYLNRHRAALSKRHVALNDKPRWFKTIDRIYPSRALAPKLLIPDIGSEVIAVYDEGRFQPNNSIYFIGSESWDLYALKTVLLSDITKLFLVAYSTKIANGFLRFQAQHLRKLRLPSWSSVTDELRGALIEAGRENNRLIYNDLVCRLYQLTDNERAILGV